MTSPTQTEIETSTMPTTLTISGTVYEDCDARTPATNRQVVIDFNGEEYTTTTDSNGNFSKTVNVPEYGTYYLDITVPKLTGHYTTVSFLRGKWYEGYYWVGLRMYINDVEVDPDNYPPLYNGDEVKICGKLYKSSGQPQPNRTINLGCVVSDVPYLHCVTDSNGYFEFVTTAPDWSKEWLCDERARAYYITALECRDSNGYPTSSDFNATLKCKEVEKPQPMFVIEHIDELNRDEKVAYLEYNGQKCWPEHWIEVEAGETITAKAKIVNQGAKGTCWFYVFDKTNSSYITHTSKVLDENEEWQPSLTFTAPDSDTEYELHACYTDPTDGKVYTSDEAGCW